MRLLRTSFLVIAASALAGCVGSAEPNVTDADKANLERLHKDGIGKVMADQASKEGKAAPSLANPDGGPGPESKGP